MSGEGIGKRVESQRKREGGSKDGRKWARPDLQKTCSPTATFPFSPFTFVSPVKPGAQGRHARLSATERKSNLLA